MLPDFSRMAAVPKRLPGNGIIIRAPLRQTPPAIQV
jgi:hypothetical protein